MTLQPTTSRGSEKGSIAHQETVGVSEELDGIDPADDKRLRRKADMFVLPYMCLIQGFQFLDKICMAYAAVMGFLPDNHLSVSEYSWLGSIFWIGYLVGQYPMVWLLQRLPLSKVTAMNIITWGAILCLMCVGKNYQGLLAVRFFLGVFECSITPSIIIYTSQWYKPREQGSRTGLWGGATGIVNILGGSIGYGLAKAGEEGSLSLPGWKIVFILFGCATIFIGFLFLFLVPDSPETAWFLNEEDRKLATLRVGLNNKMSNTHTFKLSQAKEAITDPLIWIYCFLSAVTNIPNGGITAFYGILVQGFGFSPSQTLLLGMANATISIWKVVFLWLGDKIRRRCLITLIPLLISTAGALMVWLLPEHQRAARLVGYYLVLAFAVGTLVGFSVLATNVQGRTKKTVANASYFVFSCVGNLVGPQTFQSKYAPRYVPALATFMATNICTMVCMVAIHFIYRSRNRQRDRMSGDAPTVPLNHDLTDRENPNFRYAE